MGWKDRAQPVQAAKSSWRDRAEPEQPAPPAEAAPPEQRSSAWDAFAGAAGNGFTKGWADEMSNALDGGAPAYRKLPDGTVVPYATKDALRDQRKLEADEHPLMSFGGNVVGEIASDAAISYLTRGMVNPANPLAAAGLGAFSGAGNATEETPGGTAGGAAIGAGAGLVGHGLGKYAVPAVVGAVSKMPGAQLVKRGVEAVGGYADDALNAIPESVRKFATEQALKAAGYIGKDIKPIARRDPGLIQQKGQTLLDEGMVRFGDDAAAVEARLEPAVGEAGQRVGDMLKQADATGAKFSMGNFVDRARAELLDPILNDPAKARKAQWLAAKLDEYEKLGDLPFSEANRLKTNLQSEINYGNRWSDTSPDPQEFWKELSGTMMDEIDSQVGREAGSGVQQLFKQAKGKYGTLVDALDKSRQGLARDAGNAFVSTKDALIGAGVGQSGMAASMLAGDPVMAAGSLALGGLSTLGSKLMRERGSSAMAVGANKLAGGLEALVKARPQMFGKFAPALQQAATKGPQALATANYVLSQQDPLYRELMQKVAEMGDEPDDEVAQR